MKKILLILIAVTLAAPFAAFAADSKAAAGKNPCLLDSKYCDSTEKSDSLQEKITKFKGELQKGASVYTADELQLLSSKLDDYQSFLTVISYN